MSNKRHKRRRTKGRARDFRGSLASGRTGQPPPASSVTPRQVVAPKVEKAAVGEGIRGRVTSDLGRILLSAAIVLSVLTLLYFVLR